MLRYDTICTLYKTLGLSLGFTWTNVGLVPWRYQGWFLRGITFRLSLSFLNKEQEFERTPLAWGNGRLVVLAVETRRHTWEVAGSMVHVQDACREWRDDASQPWA